VGVSHATVRQWKARNTSGFNDAYRELLAQPLLHARAEMLLLTEKAIHRLGELVDSANPQVAQAAIDRVLKGRDAQMVSNNVKVEAADGGDLYTTMLLRLTAMRAARVVVAPSTAEEPAEEAIDAEFRKVPEA
jgi:hypothetical protein